MTGTLPAHAQALGVTLSGSVIAVPTGQRTDHARLLTAEGHWVHADRIEGSYRGQAGVSLPEIRGFANLPDIRLDVHLMVDDILSDLDKLPGHGIDRVTLQSDGRDDLTELVSRAREHASEVWLALHTGSIQVTDLRETGADGVLVMLTPPGQPGHQADLNQLSLVRVACHHDWPVGVDGGVTAANLDPINEAGAVYAVAGRSLTQEAVNR
ncbi:MAG: hypothetical protein WA991_07870 [Ornithinimicrobium sp.]